MPSREFSIRPLNRGGILVGWGDLLLQMGAYPETIKDTMQCEGVPQIFVVPERLFDTQLGVSAAELEFPIYFNFYCKSRMTRFVCRPHQLRPLIRVLKEAVFGPSNLDYENEYLQGAATPGYPDLGAEMRWYKKDSRFPGGRLRLRNMVTPSVFDQEGKVDIDGYCLQDLGHDRYRLSYQGQSHEFSYSRPGLDKSEPAASNTKPPFLPPRFGMTVLGSGHGFDVQSLTSGFILWVNGKGILVDPPVHTTEWLRRENVDSRYIEDIVLTHCHADHDSGTLQKVLQEGRVTVHSTATVMESFVRKYRSLTGLSGAQFSKLFEFRAVPVGQVVNIAGADFVFDYRLHPIPTLGFVASFQGRRFAYSCDTLYEPEAIKNLCSEGVLSPERCQSLLDFDWQADLILHEAGIPPIHTPLQVLADLPEEVRRRMYLTHISESAIPPDSGLRLAPPGAEKTIVLPVPPQDTSHSQQMLDVLSHVDLFQSLSLGRAAEFLRISRYSKIPAGSTICATGEVGEDFHIILSGVAQVSREGHLIKHAGRYDYFGEIALVLERPRIADVTSITDMEIISIRKRDFLDFIRGSDIAEFFRRVALNKMEGCWKIFACNNLLRNLSTYQKTQLLAQMTRHHLPAGTTLFAQGQRAENFWILSEGEVHLRWGEDDELVVTRGTLIGQVDEDLGECYHLATATTVTEVEIHRLSIKSMRHFFLANPGVFIRYLRQQQEAPLDAVL